MAGFIRNCRLRKFYTANFNGVQYKICSPKAGNSNLGLVCQRPVYDMINFCVMIADVIMPTQ